jgi:hypothetical protein
MYFLRKNFLPQKSHSNELFSILADGFTAVSVCFLFEKLPLISLIGISVSDAELNEDLHIALVCLVGSVFANDSSILIEFIIKFVNVNYR